MAINKKASSNPCRLVVLLTSTIAVLWTLFLLYELREAFADPATRANARKRMLEDLKGFTKTGKDFLEQLHSSLHVILTTYKVQLYALVDTAMVFVRQFANAVGVDLHEMLSSLNATIEEIKNEL